MLKKEREITELHNQFNNTVAESTNRECKLKTELDVVKQQLTKSLEHAEKDKLALKTEQQQTIACLAKKHEEEITSLQNFLSNERDSVVQLELQRIKDENESLKLETVRNETGLQNKLSDLSAQLVNAKDELVLSQQRERNLEDEIHRIRKQCQEADGLLEREKDISAELQQKLKVAEKDTSELMETREIQNEELRKMSCK